MALGALTTHSACSSNTVFGLFNMPCANDASAIILQEIFGREVASMVTGMAMPAKAELIPHFLHNFNAVILSGILLIYAVIICVGTVNTGHHGKFLGQQWDSIWTPLRAIGGTAFMVPLKYGLCGAQVVVLGLLLYGAHAATVVWHTSLHDVRYGSPPTVPASGISLVQQAIANDIIMATYNALNNGPPPANGPTMTSTVDFFGPAASAIQAQASDLSPGLCKLALGLYNPTTKTVIPDRDITGSFKGYLNICKMIAQDFMQSGTPKYLDSNQKGAFCPIFSTPCNGDGPTPEITIGTLTPRKDAPMAPCWASGVLTSSCLLDNNEQNPRLGYLYSLQNANGDTIPAYEFAPEAQNPNNQSIQPTQQAFGSTPPPPPPNSAGGQTESHNGEVAVTGNVDYIAAKNPTKAQMTLNKALQKFVAANITSSGCRSMTPPASCSNNINSIVKAFNKYLKKQSSFPKGGYTISKSTQTPTAETGKNQIPGTHEPLNSSWWNAGQVYLIIDQQMASNLSKLLAQLADLTTNTGLAHSDYHATEKAMLTYNMFPFTTLSLKSGVILNAKTDTTSTPGLWASFLSPYQKNIHSVLDQTIYKQLEQLPPHGYTLTL